MLEYQKIFDTFDLKEFEDSVFSGKKHGWNAAYECCDRWVNSNKIALNWISSKSEFEKLSYRSLEVKSKQFANMLIQKGIKNGDVVAGLLPRIPELLVVIVGTWRIGAVYQPLFTAFGPKAIETRVSKKTGSNAKIILTDSINKSKLDDLPNCPLIIEIDRSKDSEENFNKKLIKQKTDLKTVSLTRIDPFTTLFTSGTTGNPKGVVYPNEMLTAIAAYMIYGIGLHKTDSYWCMADPGWAYGLLYAVIGPLLLGATTTMYEGGFTTESTLSVIEQLNINNLAAAPTVYRLLMSADKELKLKLKGKLRVASSAGEPLNPELSRWAEKELETPLCDHYGQSEFGMTLANHHGLKHKQKKGSAGLPMPGMTVDILDKENNPLPPGEPGNLAINISESPLFMFKSYGYGATSPIQKNWYLSGDTMMKDKEGYYFFVGRSDDIITSSGYRIGPFDVESALIEHQAVTEAAVIGKPDPERTEIVKAFIVLQKGFSASDSLIVELQNYVRKRLSAHAFPREVSFIDELPKTPSGKVQRFLLRGK